ncbi:MAG: lytic transglycosylase domain-containing protein [Thermoanaerobaculia bacterium]
MKRLLAAVALVLMAMPALAGVKLVVRSDGSKAIVNDGKVAATGISESSLRWLARQRNRESRYDAIIDRYSEAYGVDPVLVRAVIQVESNFNPAVVSTKGARGLMQLMPETAKRFRVTKIHDPEQNIRGGIAYLAFLRTLHPGDLRLVLASYNAGENAVKRYRGIPPYRETQLYVQKALTVYHGRPYGGGAISVRPKQPSSSLGGGFREQPPQLPPYAGVAAAGMVRTLSQ